MESFTALNNIDANEKVLVRKIESGRRMLARVTSLGILPQTEITIIQKNRHGPLLIKVDNNTLSIGQGIAEKIMVQKLNTGKFS